MELVSNPFFVLRVGPQHTREQITEAAENLALASEDPEYARARALLTHPRNRIAAEIGWLPGVAPNLALVLVDRIRSAPQAIGEVLPKLPPLARCNVVAMLLVAYKVKGAKLARWLQYIAKSYEEIDAGQLVALMNGDREAAGFAPIPSADSVEAALFEHRKYLASTMRDALDKVEDPDAVLTAVVEASIAKGAEPVPELIGELVDKYQVEVQKYLDQLAEQVAVILGYVRSAPQVAMEKKLALIDEKVRAWGRIARPVQIVMHSKGIDDEASSKLANQLREIAVCLANEHEMHAEATRISKLMSEVFKELPLFSQALNEDLAALEKIMARKENGGIDPEWAEEIELDLRMGLVLKSRLTIDAKRITYNGKSINTADVDRVRWGGLVQYVNGIKTGSYHTIWIGSPERTIKIECARTFRRASAEENYRDILDKLWKAVCVRLLNTTLSRIAAGEKIRYGRIIVDREGILLPKRVFLIGSVPYHAAWEELRIGNGKGTFFIESAKEKKANVHLPYREVENLHILEALLRFLWKDGNLERLKAGHFK